MGCDIHLAVQIKRDGKWERVEPIVEHKGKFIRQQFDVTRNYTLFQVLAGIRPCNIYPYVPIVPNRGFPEDFAAEMKDDSHESTWMVDGTFHYYSITKAEE